MRTSTGPGTGILADDLTSAAGGFGDEETLRRALSLLRAAFLDPEKASS
jgi:hypothetical protein